MDEIDGKNPNLVRALAAKGLSVEDIAGMTRTSESFVREVLKLPDDVQGATPGLIEPLNEAVNTTSKNK